jgi:GDP-L-fucose synthase
MTIGKQAPIFVAGHRGMVGSALVRRLEAGGYSNIVRRTRAELDLLDGEAVRRFLVDARPTQIFVAAAKVGGIHANDTYRAEFLYENLVIETNIIHGAHMAGVEQLMFLGSSCIYPRDCSQPMKEEYLLTGPLEPTNEAYAVAKIAGIKLCDAYRHQYGRNYVSVMPANLYGKNDNYHPENSHVLPALIRRAHEAKQRGDDKLLVWGSGRPRREFLHADDLADACVHLMEADYSGPLLNIGTGKDISIAELATLVCKVVGYRGALVFDTSRPDGTPRKVLNIDRLLRTGWQPRVALSSGIREVYADFLGSGGKRRVVNY